MVNYSIEPILKSLDEVKIEKIGEMKRQLLFSPLEVGNPRLRIAVNEAEAEASAQPHTHPGEEIVFTISGEAVINIKGVDHVVKPNTALMIPPNTEHFAVAGKTGWKAIAIFCDECNCLLK